MELFRVITLNNLSKGRDKLVKVKAPNEGFS